MLQICVQQLDIILVPKAEYASKMFEPDHLLKLSEVQQTLFFNSPMAHCSCLFLDGEKNRCLRSNGMLALDSC